MGILVRTSLQQIFQQICLCLIVQFFVFSSHASCKIILNFCQQFFDPLIFHSHTNRIDNHSCRKIGTEPMKRVLQAFREYGYHGFWNNGYSYLREDELENVTQPSESILLVSDVRLYKNDYGKAKIDFTWSGLRYPMRGVSLTDQDFYDILDDEEVCYKYAIIVISIPKDADWTHPETGERRAYKFVSKVFGSDK